MEMHQVRYFLALSDELNFSRAAEKCNVTQSALSRAIQQLEVELGGELVHRERYLTHLTELGQMMRNVAVTVEHGRGPRGLLGLYQGVPLTSRTSQYAGVLPDHITIYRRAICAICRTEQEVAEQVRRTVIHEVAHHFGIDDDRLRELGW